MSAKAILVLTKLKNGMSNKNNYIRVVQYSYKL